MNNAGQDLVRKSYRSILIAWLTAMIWCLAPWKPWIALSITLGTLMATGILASLDWLVRRAFVPGASRPRRALVMLGAVQLLVIGIVVYRLVHWPSINLPAFVGGIVVVHFAILAKAIGLRAFGRGERP